MQIKVQRLRETVTVTLQAESDCVSFYEFEALFFAGSALKQEYSTALNAWQAAGKNA